MCFLPSPSPLSATSSTSSISCSSRSCACPVSRRLAWSTPPRSPSSESISSISNSSACFWAASPSACSAIGWAALRRCSDRSCFTRSPTFSTRSSPMFGSTKCCASSRASALPANSARESRWFPSCFPLASAALAPRSSPPSASRVRLLRASPRPISNGIIATCLAACSALRCSRFASALSRAACLCRRARSSR